jgi:DNA mismatch repair protein MutL
VRFRDAISVREAVQVAVSGALAELRRVSVATPVRVFAEPESVDVAPSPNPASVAKFEPVSLPVEIVEQARALPVIEQAAELPLPETPAKETARFRFIGALADRYVLLEDDAGLVLLDHRAARERILFEQLLRRIDAREAASQRLLIPAVVELAPRDLAWVREHAALLGSAGISVEPFGAGSVKIDGVPPMLAHCEPRDVLLRVADDCRAAGGARGGLRAVEESLARSVCRSASFGGVPEDAAAAHALLDELMACELPYTCPAGRPTMIHFAHSELERKFGRHR